MPKPKREKPRREKVKYLRPHRGKDKDDTDVLKPAEAYRLMNLGIVAPAADKPKTKSKPEKSKLN